MKAEKKAEEKKQFCNKEDWIAVVFKEESRKDKPREDARRYRMLGRCRHGKRSVRRLMATADERPRTRKLFREQLVAERAATHSILAAGTETQAEHTHTHTQL